LTYEVIFLREFLNGFAVFRATLRLLREENPVIA